MANRKSEDDVRITKEELNEIKDALKKEEFRKLLNNYFEEVNDPKNQALYQKELTEFERQRGVDITFINPEPGYVIKSSTDGKRKAFINICSNENVDKPSSSIASKDGSPGLDWSIPYLQGQPREDLDKKNECCSVYDVVFHPDALYLARKNVRIKTLIEDIALSAVEDSFKVKLDRKNLAFPKMRYKGLKVATVIRKRREDYENMKKEEDEILQDIPYPYDPPPAENIPKVTVPRSNYDDDDDSLYTTPRYILKHRREVDMQEFTNSPEAKLHSAIPSNLVVEIDLPLVRSAADVKLDVMDKSLSLSSEKPAKYKLNVSLPYSVDEDNGNAKFDKAKKRLIVTLPVNRCKLQLPDFVREDSGIESDANQNNCSSSEEDIRKNVDLLQVNDASFSEAYEEKHTNVCVVAARTNEEIKTQFLSPDIHYSFPTNTVTVKEDSLSIRIVVKNIDPQSVVQQFICENRGIHFKFSSLGAGFFPIRYAFCMRLLDNMLDTTSLNIEVWDNCLMVALKLNTTIGSQISSYLVGISLESMEEKKLISAPSEIKSSTLGKNIKEQTEEKLEMENSKEKDCKSEDNFNLNTIENLESKKSELSEEKKNTNDGQHKDSNKSTISNIFVKNKPLGATFFKNRTVSESSELPETFASGKRSILKGSRSLSESHTEDYYTWSSLDSESHDDLVANKKTVRFSDVVSKKIFRANSSILGQKKKNEKKSRNRKKAAYERMLSAGSEESETDREEYDSISDISDLSDMSSDDSNSGISPSVITVVPSSKRHRRRGAKNQRKAAAIAKHNHLAE